MGAKTLVKAKMKDQTTMLVDLTTRTERIAFYTGVYDPELIKIMHQLYTPNSSFLDIGANIGFYTVSMGNLFRKNKSTGKVIAFEPFEGNYDRLTHNLNLNKLEKHCITNKIGLSNESTQCQISLREDFQHGSSTGNTAILTSEAMDEGFIKATIELERLDDFWSKTNGKYGNIDLIKMDIEGHEDFCLEGGNQTLKIHRPTILMEVNKPYYTARNIELDARFKDLIPEDYVIYRQDRSNWIPIHSLNECGLVDNVFLIPKEKLSLETYHIFGNVACIN